MSTISCAVADGVANLQSRRYTQGHHMGRDSCTNGAFNSHSIIHIRAREVSALLLAL